MRILFVTWDGGGNVNPLLALGPRLAARGWDVHAYGPPSLADRFAAGGIAYAARDVADPWDVTAMAGDVRDEIVRTGADVVLVDYMLPGALCGAEATGRPTAALVPLPPDTPVGDLRAALADVLDTPSYRTAAAALGATMATSPATAEAELEGLA